MSRAMDWLTQSEAFLRDARRVHKKKSYYLTCFTCQQSAEFALKAASEFLKLRCWGHDLPQLLAILETQGKIVIPPQIQNACSILSKYYISARYPDAYSQGTPSTLFSKQQSRSAIQLANEVVTFAKSVIK